MIRAVILAAFVAICAAKVELKHCCSADDRNAVMSQWNSIWNTPDSSMVKIVVGNAVFKRFMHDNPETVALFNRVNVEHPESPEFAGHMIRVLTGLDLMINMLQDERVLQEEIDHLTVQHRAREGVTRAHFQSMGRILLDELPHVLGSFDRAAWTSCFRRFIEHIGGH